jgi:hypothetical protein
MKAQRCLGVLLAFGFLLTAPFARGQDEKKKAPPPPNYYPLQVGNEWNFRVTVGGNSVNAISRIAKIETIDGKPLARLEASLNGNIVATEHLRVTPEGVFRYRNNGQEIVPPICLLKFPAKSNSKWDGNIKVGAEQGKYFCEAKEANVEVPAGKFKALHVAIRLETKGQTVTTAYWFVPNVGFVRQTVDAGGMSILMELEKYTPGKSDKK